SSRTYDPTAPFAVDLNSYGADGSLKTRIANQMPSRQPKIRKKTSNPNARIVMNNQFDELTKSLAQSVTRRAALKKFSVGLVGMALACFGLANKAAANNRCNVCVEACM